jgi:hypothetical protein
MGTPPELMMRMAKGHAARPVAGEDVENGLVVIGPTHLVATITSNAKVKNQTHGATIRFQVKGAALDAAAVGVVNRMETTLITAQAAGMPADVTRGWASSMGIRTLIAESWNPDAAIAVDVDEGMPKGRRYQQDGPALTPSDLDHTMVTAIQRARIVVLIGDNSTTDTSHLVLAVVRLAPAAYVVLVPDPTLARLACECGVLNKVDLVYMNAAAGSSLPGSTKKISQNALRLRYLADSMDCGIESPIEAGYLWTSNRWLVLPPTPSDPQNPMRMPAVFATGFAIARIRGLRPLDAMRYASNIAQYTLVPDRRILAWPTTAPISPEDERGQVSSGFDPDEN